MTVTDRLACGRMYKQKAMLLSHTPELRMNRLSPCATADNETNFSHHYFNSHVSSE